MRKRGGEVRKGGNNGESLPLRSLLDARRMRREHTGRVSKDAYEAGQGEGKWFHHGCITILVVGCLKRCLYPSTGRSGLSTGVTALQGLEDQDREWRLLSGGGADTVRQQVKASREPQPPPIRHPRLGRFHSAFRAELDHPAADEHSQGRSSTCTVPLPLSVLQCQLSRAA